MVRSSLYIAFLFLAINSLAQGDYVKLEVEPRTVETGQEFKITIKTNVEGQINMNLPDEFIQSGVRQSGMSSSVEIIKGKQKVIRYTHQTFTGYFENEGQYFIGPVKIKTKKKEVRSEAYSVKVIKPQNMISADPSKNMNQLVFGIIEQSKKEIYEGESIVLEGKVYSQVEILQIENYASFAIDGPSDARDLNKANQVTSNYEVVNGRNVQTFKIGKQLVFPEKVGTYTIKPFKTVIAYNDPRRFFPERIKVISNETQIVVKPLPTGTPKNFIDAVGQFSVSASIDKSELDQGDVVELKVKVSGKGNLQNIQEPKIQLPHYLSFYGDPEITDEITYCTLGAEGNKTFTYFIQVNSGGNIQLDPIEIAYFNPTTKKYETSKATVKTLKVKSTEKDLIVASQQAEEVTESELKPYISTYYENKDELINRIGLGGALLLISPFMLGAFLGLLVRVRRQQQEKNSDLKQRTQQQKEILNSLENIKFLDSEEEKVNLLSQQFNLFLAEQFEVEKGKITRGYLKQRIPNELSEEQYIQIISILDQLEAIKFGGSKEHQDVNAIYNQIKQVTNTFE